MVKKLGLNWQKRGTPGGQGQMYGLRKPREGMVFGLQALVRGMITTPDEGGKEQT